MATKEQVLRSKVLRSRDRFWAPSDLAGSSSTVLHALSRLVEEGELRRVRKGLYWRGTMTALGMSPPASEKLVEVLAGKKGVGPAGLSAANALRLSTQVPRYRHVAVPSRPPTGVPRVTFHDRSARKGRTWAQLDATEIAVLEVLDGWEKLIEVPGEQAWQVLEALVTSGGVRPERLAQASWTEPARVKERLVSLLSRAGRLDAVEQIQRGPKSRLAHV